MVWMPEGEGDRKEVQAVRVIVFGPDFPQRAVEPELLVGEEIAQRTCIARDQKSIRGYFLRIPPDGAAIRVRYGASLEGELGERFARNRVRSLDTDCDRQSTPLSFDDFSKALIAQLTEEERQGGVAYASEDQLPAGTHLQLPGIQIDVPRDSYLGFVDREPDANWGHAARYVIVDRESGAIRSLAARLPPFSSGGDPRWRVIYQAPAVPDTFVEHST
jgi:hypothetical protein